jgi:hypothetical protein
MRDSESEEKVGRPGNGHIRLGLESGRSVDPVDEGGPDPLHASREFS